MIIFLNHLVFVSITLISLDSALQTHIKQAKKKAHMHSTTIQGTNGSISSYSVMQPFEMTSNFMNLLNSLELSKLMTEHLKLPFKLLFLFTSKSLCRRGISAILEIIYSPTS